MKLIRSFFRNLFYSVFILVDLALILFVAFFMAVTIKQPSPAPTPLLAMQRTEPSPGFYRLGNSWLRKSETGLYEMYVEGNGFERGVTEGKLNKELAEKQEVAFVKQIRRMIPSEKMLHYLKYFIAFFNRHLDEYVIDEYKNEIYGESLYASDKFDFMAPKYYRMLNGS